MQKDIPRKKFLETEFCSSRQNHSRPNSSENCGFGRKSKTQFPKTFFGGYLFAFVEYLCNCSPKIKTKNIKNYSSILAIVNHRNWLDDSPPLIALKISKSAGPGATAQFAHCLILDLSYVPAMSKVPGRLEEMSRFFVRL